MMHQIRETLRFISTTDMSNRKISGLTGLSNSTVRRYRKILNHDHLQWGDVDVMDDTRLDRLLHAARSKATDKRIPDWSAVHDEMQYRHVTLQLLWEEYRLVDPAASYSYSQFTHYYRQFVSKLELSMRQTHRAGEYVFVDFAGRTVPWTCRETTKIHEAQIFVGVLGCSNNTFVFAVPSQSVPYWIEAHNEMFRYFGGAPRVVVPDNLKSAVIKPGSEPELNRTYRDMARHYGMVIMPARVRRPKDKAKAENGVLIVSRWIIARLRKQQFFSLAEINAAISYWLEKLNERPFKQLPGNRRSRFEQLDAPKLQSLPGVPFEYAEWVGPYKVTNDYHVNVKDHYYSVPHELVQSVVEVRVTARTVELFSQGKRVASHLRSEIVGGQTTIPAHQPPAHRRYAEQDFEIFLEWAESVGQATVAVVRYQFGNQEYASFAQRACSTLQKLARDYSSERLEIACRRAQAIDSMTLSSIRSILKRKPTDNEISLPAAASLAAHENIRGAGYYMVGGR